ncbi:hypothetical protein DEA8626_03874 [Defluviimonas aquaemixtae]|uniref:HTH-like domain-containing protein n=1 Tax=Albidovulum aquaemixtae TaxID=1542388 RepID=A0A2R8BN30_9RHOB|nr:hypothetical protein [Defluviimonas aquaemixtae]SPH24841.1 hypothetical protein DEA8626_03874 [Defluviimonas aquaemixtae]
MTADDLGRILRAEYDKAEQRQKAVAVVCFGIKYAQQLKSQSVAAVSACADIGKWAPQISLGVNLAEHVELKKP